MTPATLTPHLTDLVLALADRTITDGLDHDQGDPAECLVCGAQFLAGETHRTGCRVDLAEKILLEIEHRRTRA